LHKLPFEILAQKTPFLEYLIRVFKFIKKPQIEETLDLPDGEMKYALWDIISVVSLFTVLTGIMSLFDNNNYNKALGVFSNQFTLYFQFGYYAFWSTLTFFIIIFIALSLRFRKFELNKAFLCTLQYARFYALFLFLLFPLFVWNLNLIIIELSNVKHWTGKNYLIGLLILSVFIYLYVRCYLNPTSEFSNLSANNNISKIFILILSLTAFSLNIYAPTIGILDTDHKKVCDLALSNNKFDNIDKLQKERMLDRCINKAD
jgi:hypothetical protein